MNSKILFIHILFMFSTIQLKAQWTSASPDLTTTDFVGIGTTTPASALHVNGNNMTGPATTGEVFRTDGPSGSAQRWRMFRNGTEYGQLFNPSTSTNFTIQATDNHLNFNSGYNGAGLESMRIVGGNGSSKRFVGIGDYSNANFATAQNQLHQWISGNTNVYHQFSNDNTTVSDGNKGFKLGITYNGTYSDAELISQQNGANMNFYTSSGSVTNRMQIAAGGSVGIGDNAQAADKLYVKNDYAVSSAHTGIETYTYATGSTPLTGIYAKAYSDGGTGGATMGGYLYALGTSSTSSGIGAKCVSENCDDSNFGVRAFGTGGTNTYKNRYKYLLTNAYC